MTEPDSCPHESAVVPISRRVIVAESDPVFRKLIASCLRKDGFEVDEVADGATLLRHVATARAESAAIRLDLVVATTCLPGFGCVGMLLGIEAQLQQLPLVLIKRAGEHRPQVLAHRPWAQEVECHPFALDRLRQLVSYLLAPDCAPASCRIAV